MEDEKKENVDTQTTTDNAKKEQKAENKNEGEKTKKQIAQKGDDGSIVFKNQDELDGFIRRMYAKGAEKAAESPAAIPQAIMILVSSLDDLKHFSDSP